MNWGLSQGIIGRGRESMVPSALAVGPNTYLSQHDFLKMLGIACVVHVVVLVIASLMPQEKVTSIPVRALSFKLGDSNRVTMTASKPAPAPLATPPAPVMKATTQETWRASAAAPQPKVPAPLRPITAPPPAPQPQPTPVKAPKVVPITDPSPRQVPVENASPVLAPIPTSAPTPPVPVPATPSPPLAALPAVEPQNAPAIAPNPQQYVREVGAAAAPAIAAPKAGSPAQVAEAIRERYEQQISAWVGRHKLYPADAAGREGRVVIRMRIDRTGYVRYYAIEQSSGVSPIDMAALDMIRRANPMPAVPENYPSGNLIEFLIPITFRSPR